MAVNAIGVVDSSTSSVPQNAAIGQDDCLRILLTQLRFQDPLKPVDNQEFVAQLAQFSALENTRQQSEKVDSLLQVSGADQAIGLLGKQVQAGAANSVGTVTAISFASGTPTLTVQPPPPAPNIPASPIIGVKLSDITLVRTP
jgi:flagellar basal-body rod modification protein FlgD